MALGGTTGMQLILLETLGLECIPLIPRKNKNAEWNYSGFLFWPFLGGAIAGIIYNF